jgi:hypothetical protein
MAAPKKKFSFMRLISNAIPNFARDDPNDVGLSPTQADYLLRYQLNLPFPRYLGKNAFFNAGIADSEGVSEKIYKALVKNEIILPVPEMGSSGDGSGSDEDEQMTVNTAGITKNFANQLAIISVHAQRKLVGMLFFWEEECMRWKLLDEEEKEILEGLARGNSENRDIALALEAVEMKRTLLPSQREEDTANVGKGRGHELPAHS